MHEWLTLATSYPAAFIAGLFGGVHCLGMCGGIVTALSFGLPAEKRQDFSHTLKILSGYNLGRIASYSLAGGLAGSFGALLINLSDTATVSQLQSSLHIIAALFMIALGLYLGRFWTGLRYIEHFGSKLWQYIEPFGRRFMPVRSLPQAFGFGLIWGWLPCGLTYSILFWSIASGGFIEGALFMLAFGIGTLPNLLAIGIFTSSIQQWTRKTWLQRLAGILVILFGLGLLGLQVYPL